MRQQTVRNLFQLPLLFGAFALAESSSLLRKRLFDGGPGDAEPVKSSAVVAPKVVANTVSGKDVVALTWGAPTKPFSLKRDSTAEWSMLLPAYTRTRCTLKASEGETGDADLALYGSRSNIICASNEEYANEECSYWGNADDLEIKVGVAAFDDIDNRP